MFVFSPSSKLYTICIGFFYIPLNIQVFAQCDNFIGTIGNADTIYLCQGASLLLEVDSVALLDNQELYYIFGKIDNSGFYIPWFEINQTGFFENDDVPSGEIMAQAFIAETDEFGNANLEDPCFAGSNMISIVNLNQIQVVTEVICQPTNFLFSISGGLPEFDEDSFYEVTGSHFIGNVGKNELVSIETEYSSSFVPAFNIDVNDELGCKAIYQSPAGYICNQLPIQLVSFDGRQTEAGNLLEWVSLYEQDIDFFKIEIYKDHSDWIIVDTVNAEGNLSTTVKYEFLDEKHTEEIYYYRLLAVETNGVVNEAGHIKLFPLNYFKVYPTFASNLLNIEHNIQKSVQFLIYDTAGKVVFSTNEESHQAHSVKQMDITHLPNNIYYLVIISDDFTASQKFVVQQ